MSCKYSDVYGRTVETILPIEHHLLIENLLQTYVFKDIVKDLSMLGATHLRPVYNFRRYVEGFLTHRPTLGATFLWLVFGLKK